MCIRDRGKEVLQHVKCVSTLTFVACEGEEMDLSPPGEVRNAAATSLPERVRRAVMTVGFPGAFGAPPPPNVDVRLWRYDERETNQEEGGEMVMQVDSKRYFQPSLRPHPPQPPPAALFQQHERSATHACVMGSICLLYTSPSPRDKRQSRMPSSA